MLHVSCCTFTESAAIQIGGVLQYKLEVYCNTFLKSSGRWVFLTFFCVNTAPNNIPILCAGFCESDRCSLRVAYFEMIWQPILVISMLHAFLSSHDKASKKER